MPGNWLSLSEVAELLGVHPGTVRNWADQGVLPVHRTQGGHRRFMRSDIELWIESQRLNQSNETNGMFQNALGYARIQIIEAHLEEQGWYQKLDDEARDTYRLSGRTLMQGLMKSQALDEEDAAKEARAIGTDYGSIGRRYGLTVLEATQAFLFFRNVLMDAALHIYEKASIQSPHAWAEMSRTFNAFTDTILIAIIENYQIFQQAGQESE